MNRKAVKSHLQDLLSFIKNENDTIPLRIRGILTALKNNEKIKLFPKRNYEFRSFFEDEN